MALREMIEKEAQAQAQADSINQELIASLPEAIEKTISDIAQETYDEICRKIASVVGAGNQSKAEGFVEVPNGFVVRYVKYLPVQIPQDMASTYGIKVEQPDYSYEGNLSTPGGFSITVYRMKYPDSIVLGTRCRLEYFNHTVWNKLFEATKMLCEREGIILESACLAELDHNGMINRKFGLNDTYRIKWHAELGGGWPEYKQIVALPFSYRT